MSSGAIKLIKQLEEKSVLWMGILNITQDSFSDGGDFYTRDAALQRVNDLIRNGADIIDIGACSTRPGSDAPSWQDELNRLKPILEKIRLECLDKNVLISLDSFQPRVAQSLAQDKLIDIINDVMACRHTVDLGTQKIGMFDVVKNFDLGLIIMHMQGEPKTMQLSPHYENCVEDVKGFLQERLEKAKKIGIKALSIDPGIGFGKLFQHNMDLISHHGLSTLKSLHYPITIGLSRKSFLNTLLKKEVHAKERDLITKKLELSCIKHGARIIRTHKLPQEGIV